MKKNLIFITIIILILSLSSCGKELAVSHDTVWITADGSSWFICGSTYSKAILNGIGYAETILANSPYDLMFFRDDKVMVKLQYRLKKDYLKCVCTKDDNGDIGVDTEFIFYPHNINEDTPMMAAWRESLDVKSDTLWVTEDGTSWFIRSENREEAVINGVIFSNIDISNFPNSLFFKKDGEFVLTFRAEKITDEYVDLYCSYDEENIIGIGSNWRFYPQKQE